MQGSECVGIRTALIKVLWEMSVGNAVWHGFCKSWAEIRKRNEKLSFYVKTRTVK